MGGLYLRASLGGGDGGMPQNPLDLPDIHLALEQASGAGVSKRVDLGRSWIPALPRPRRAVEQARRWDVAACQPFSRGAHCLSNGVS